MIIFKGIEYMSNPICCFCDIEFKEPLDQHKNLYSIYTFNIKGDYYCILFHKECFEKIAGRIEDIKYYIDSNFRLKYYVSSSTRIITPYVMADIKGNAIFELEELDFIRLFGNELKDKVWKV